MSVGLSRQAQTTECSGHGGEGEPVADGKYDASAGFDDEGRSLSKVAADQASDAER